jgi:hypothetical protein
MVSGEYEKSSEADALDDNAPKTVRNEDYRARLRLPALAFPAYIFPSSDPTFVSCLSKHRSDTSALA